MHENACAHVARTVGNLLDDLNIAVLPWPVQSPDLNPIEHMSDMLQRRLLNQGMVFQTKGELSNCLLDQWHQIDQNATNNLIISMSKCVKFSMSY